MDQRALIEKVFGSPEPFLVLAPMQDVTDLPFWRLMAEYGGPDIYFTEYFRVHATSALERHIVEAVVNAPPGSPVIAQMIGNDIPALVRTAKLLQKFQIAGIDLNLGCPAPVVYRKCAGGGLLREPWRVDAILKALRAEVQVKFSVKTRLGFDSPDGFDRMLEIFASHQLDMLTVHARTVKEMYWSEVHYEFIAKAAQAVSCPVVANGNIYSPTKAAEVANSTRARGLMIGRGAIRNPWLFEQIRAHFRGETVRYPAGRDVLEYVRRLYEALRSPEYRESAHVQMLKKYMNFIGVGIDASGDFLHRMRRATTEHEFFQICEDHLKHDDPLPLEPLMSSGIRVEQPSP